METGLTWKQMYKWTFDQRLKNENGNESAWKALKERLLKGMKN